MQLTLTKKVNYKIITIHHTNYNQPICKSFWSVGMDFDKRTTLLNIISTDCTCTFTQ